MPRLLEQPVAARLGLALLACGLGLRLRQEVARLRLRRVHDLGALTLRFGAVALDLGLALLQLALLRAHLLLGPLQLRRRRRLCVPLERVGELGRGADQVERVHPHGVAGRLDVRGLARSLEHPQLRLELSGVAPEGVERLADALLLVAVAGPQLVQTWKRGQPRGRTL